MLDISISTPLSNTGEVILVGSLAWLKLTEDLLHGSFRVDVRDRAGGGSLIYQWKTGGSSSFPNSSLIYEDASASLTLRCPSGDAKQYFSPDAIARVGGRFRYEIGFFQQGDTNNMLVVGSGALPFENGVIF